MQYQSECLSALKSVANIQKPFEKAFMDTMKLFMAIPDRINFLQLGRYGCFSEQTYRNLFEHETFDWFAFNGSIISKHLTGKEKPSPSILPISPNQARRHLGLVTSGPVVQESISVDWKSWASVSLTSTTMNA